MNFRLTFPRCLLFAVCVASLFSSTRSSAAELLARLPNGTKIMLDDGALRAVANGGTRWLLTAKQAHLDDGGNQPDFRANSVVFSRNRNLMALRSEGDVQVRSTSNAALRFSLRLWPRETATAQNVAAVRLANYSQQIRSHQVQPRQTHFVPVMLPGANDYVTGLAFSPDNSKLAVSGWKAVEIGSGTIDNPYPTLRHSGRIGVFSMRNGRLLKRFEVVGAHAQSVKWTSNMRLSSSWGDGRTRAFRSE